MNFYNHHRSHQAMNNQVRMARRHGPDRGGEDRGYVASLGQRKRVAHIPTADTKAARRKLVDLKDKGRRDHNLTSQIPRPSSGVHFRCVALGLGIKAGTASRSRVRIAVLVAFPRQDERSPPRSCLPVRQNRAGIINSSHLLDGKGL
jgi:hypothetical protein